MTAGKKLQLPPLKTVCASSFAGRAIPERRWVVPGYIPDRTVTILGGDGGTGKSLLALQLAAAMATGSTWLDLPVKAGPVLYVSAEDELDELHRRIVDIGRESLFNLEHLDRLHLVPWAGMDAMLSVPEQHRNAMKPTPLWHQLLEVVRRIKPSLLVIDTLADAYGGDELKRAQVRSFIGMLRGAALQEDMAVLLLAHPSVSGIENGSGSSGSTGWNNSVRSRLYLERPKSKSEDVDDDARVLSKKKSNYGALAGEIPLRYQRGVFVPESGEISFEREVALQEKEQAADRQFLDLLTEVISQGRAVSPAPGSNYAPLLFGKHPDAKGFTKKAFASALERLLKANRVHVAKVGSSTRERLHLRPGPAPKPGPAMTDQFEFGPTNGLPTPN